MHFFIPTPKIQKPLPNKITLLPEIKVFCPAGGFSLNFLPSYYFGNERGTYQVLSPVLSILAFRFDM